ASGWSGDQYKHILDTIPRAGFSSELQSWMDALVELMRHAGLAIIDAAAIERTNVVQTGDDYRVQLPCRQKTSKKEHLQPIDNAIPRHVGEKLMQVANGNPRYIFWNGGKSGEGTDQEKREAVKYWQKQIRKLLDKAGYPKSASHK